VIQKKVDKLLLYEYLDEIFTNIAKKNPFLVIFDQFQLFQDYLSHMVDNRLTSDEIQILRVESHESPKEYIDRKQIVNDFDQSLGWYKHHWIIHILGENTSKIEQFRSFAYYQELGETIKIGTIDNFLQSSHLQIIEKGQDLPILDEYPEINREIFNQLLKYPIGSIKTRKNELSRNTFWLAFLQVQKFPDLMEESLSAINRSVLVQINQIELSHVVLEWIWKWDRFEYEQMNSKSSINHFYSSFLQYLAKKLNYQEFLQIDRVSNDENKLPIGRQKGEKHHQFDIQTSLLYLIRTIVIQENKLLKSSTKSHQKQAKQKKLTELLPNEHSNKISSSTQALFSLILKEWVEHSDPLYLYRFQSWMSVLREESLELLESSTKITKNNLDTYTSQMDFTGSLDLRLMEYLLSLLENQSVKSADLQEKIQKIITLRKKVWQKNANRWWGDYPLFVDLDTRKGITLEGLWNIIQDLTLILGFDSKKYGKTSNVEWTSLRSEIWELQQKINRIKWSQITSLLHKLPDFSQIHQFIGKIDQKFTEISNQVNLVFQEYYLTQLKSKEPNFTFDWSNSLFSELKPNILAGEKSMLIFCDGLRQDLALSIMDSVSQLKSKKKHMINSHDLTPIHILSPLPSITELGWNALMVGNDTIQLQAEAEKTNISKIQINEKDGKEKTSQISNFSHEDRKNRIQSYLISLFDNKDISNNIQVKIVASNNFRKELKSLNQSNLIPIMWIDEIDNHDWDRMKYSIEIPKILEKICFILQESHLMGFENIYLITDHGFYFADKSNICAETPAGMCKNRFCISDHVFSDQEKMKDPNWIILDNEDFKSHPIHLDKNQSLIFPRNSSLFTKPKVKHIQNECYIHGGFSFQENDLLFLKSRCILYKTVQIEKIEVKNPQGFHYLTGEPAYELETERNGQQYLEIQIQGQITEENLHPTEIHLEISDPRIKFKPNRRQKLIKKSRRNYTLYFPTNEENSAIPIVDEITVRILNNQNQTIYEHSIKITVKRAIEDIF
jgi:hypothetical protein